MCRLCIPRASLHCYILVNLDMGVPLSDVCRNLEIFQRQSYQVPDPTRENISYCFWISCLGVRCPSVHMSTYISVHSSQCPASELFVTHSFCPSCTHTFTHMHSSTSTVIHTEVQMCCYCVASGEAFYRCMTVQLFQVCTPHGGSPELTTMYNCMIIVFSYSKRWLSRASFGLCPVMSFCRSFNCLSLMPEHVRAALRHQFPQVLGFSQSSGCRVKVSY